MLCGCRSLGLIAQLEERQIQSVGTVGLNRLKGLGGPSEVAMRKSGRGIFSEYVTEVNGIEVSCIHWYDNKVGSLLSSFVGAEPMQQVQRWSKNENVCKDIICPRIISVYNQHMGGVDTLDSLLGLYWIKIRSKKYYHRIFFHFLDLTVVSCLAVVS